MIIEFDCQVCGTHVRKRRSPANGGARARFCSQACYAASRKGTGQGVRPNCEFTCETCGKQCSVYRSPSAPNPRFCSLACLGRSQLGESNPAWTGGVRHHVRGYVLIYRPEHADADVRGCVLEHRLVMESVIDRRLTSVEVVHHINRIKDDNRPSNLLLLPDQAAHAALHHREDALRKGSS